MKLEFIAYGDRLNNMNPFQWKVVKFNLSGLTLYNPKSPWVMKVRRDGNLAFEVYIYLDDGQIVGHSELVCCEVARRFFSVCVLLGIQDASRKRTGPSLYPGPWSGTVVHTEGV